MRQPIVVLPHHLTVGRGKVEIHVTLDRAFIRRDEGTWADITHLGGSLRFEEQPLDLYERVLLGPTAVAQLHEILEAP